MITFRDPEPEEVIRVAAFLIRCLARRALLLKVWPWILALVASAVASIWASQ